MGLTPRKVDIGLQYKTPNWLLSVQELLIEDQNLETSGISQWHRVPRRRRRGARRLYHHFKKAMAAKSVAIYRNELFWTQVPFLHYYS